MAVDYLFVRMYLCIGEVPQLAYSQIAIREIRQHVPDKLGVGMMKK